LREYGVRRIFCGVTRLSHSDLERVVECVGEIAELGNGGDEPFPEDLLERLRGLIRSDVAAYSELDRVRERVLAGIGSGDVGDDDAAATEERFWALRHEWPSCVYEDRTLDFGAHKLSDFSAASDFKRTRLYNEHLRPFLYEISVGLPAPLTHTKLFLFFNRAERGDFGERERTILELLRPHLIRRYEHVALRRRHEPTVSAGETTAAGLTRREGQILHLIAEGRTNAEAAAELWISPATVGKHLEHAYAKLGVKNRTAAARRLHELGAEA
jgi:DNA-binding CsgD family transcriptional regulator